MTTRIASFVLLLLVLSSSAASAQSFDLAAHVVGAQWSEFDGSDFGVGVEVSTSARTFIRFDAVDRILRYPGPTFGPADEVSEDGFFGHAFKFTFGGGIRF